MDSGDFDELTKGVSKLTLNDAAVTVMPEMSAALGNGLKCGFLGLLHMEVRFINGGGARMLFCCYLIK